MEAELAHLARQPGKQDEFSLCLHEKISSASAGQFCSFYISQNNCDIVLTTFGSF